MSDTLPKSVPRAVTTGELLACIADRRARRIDVAMLYRAALDTITTIDWPTVNRAIVARWSRHALEWIKQEAWRAIKPQRLASSVVI